MKKKKSIYGDVDFTNRKPGEVVGGLSISQCPKCGRLGQGRRYKNGDSSWVHKGTTKIFFFEVTDSCMIKAVSND